LVPEAAVFTEPIVEGPPSAAALDTAYYFIPLALLESFCETFGLFPFILTMFPLIPIIAYPASCELLKLPA